MICEIHSVEMTEKEGNYGAFWSHPTTDPAYPKGWCQGKPPKTQTAAYKKFEEVGNQIKTTVSTNKDVDPQWIIDGDKKDDGVMTKAEWREKDDRIARLTLAKTYIQAGVDYDHAVATGDLDKWTLWVLTGKV